MRLATAWVVVVGLVLVGTATPARADADGFWFSVATGVAGSATPTAYQEWWFETPHGPPQVAVTSLTGGTAQATTGGGSSFFSGAAGTVVLSPTDGYAYLASGNQPSDLSQALKRQMAGGTGLASAAPATTAAIPSGADQLSVAMTATSLTVGLNSSSGQSLAGATVPVPSGGWWVVGLGPNPDDTTTTTTPTPIISTPVPVPSPPVTTPTSAPVAAPEPATGVLAGLGGLGAFGLRLFKRRRG